MVRADFNTRMLELLPHPPTPGQAALIDELVRFLYSREPHSMFLLKGYAGTGKTTVISTLVKLFRELGKKTLLLAPTGRAAKVLSTYAGARAFTIHRMIYQLSGSGEGTMSFSLAQNRFKNTLIIVDEASMIPDATPSDDSGFFSGHSLLDDLIQYTASGTNCRLILIGDTAQLPPVGLDISPALDIKYLQTSYHMHIFHFELKDVVRQARDSGILFNATEIRNNLDKQGISPLIRCSGFPDIEPITGEFLEEALNDVFQDSRGEDAIIVTRSNKRANIFNQEIRNRILFREGEIATGDLLMIVKNNYFWIPDKSEIGFLANGDMIEIMRIEKHEELYGYRFAQITARLIDYPNEKDITLKIMLDTLSIDGPSLPFADNRRFMEEVMKDYDDIPSRRQKIQKAKNNPYFNAVQVKFGYALTCHKTQGGQWDYVFIDLGYLTEEMVDRSFYRWLYTAFTRARVKIFTINFPEGFFVNN